MSDFEDSYHPVTDAQGAQDLVRRVGRAGIVLPEQPPYSCVLIDQPAGGVDPQLLAANPGLLVRYQYGEDHGVWIDLYKGRVQITQLALEWGPDFIGEGLPRGRFDATPWLATGLIDEALAARLQRLADTMVEGSDAAAGHEAAHLVGLTRFEGLSCDPSNVKRGPWHLVVERLQRDPHAIFVDLGPT